jgi:hypothetical protein
MDGSMMVKCVTKEPATVAVSEESRPVVVEWLLDPEDDARFDAAASCGGCGCA